MVKRKKSRVQFASAGFGGTNLAQGLQRAESLLRKEKWSEAMQLLSSLADQFPSSKAVWQNLTYASYELNDLITYQRAGEKLTELDPTNANHFFALGSACMGNVHPLLALQSFRQGLALAPNHEFADEARHALTELEPLLEEVLADMGLTEADGLEIAVLHERGQACLERGDYAESREATAAVIERHPEFLPAQNNLSLIAWAEGDVAAAIAQAKSVIDHQPDNIHALANLVRFYALTQRPDDARPYADRLRASHASAWDGWTKKAEALTLLADDAGLVALWDEFLAAGGDALVANPEAADAEDVTTKEDIATEEDIAEEDANAMAPPSALFYHWVAVALARTGAPKRAKEQWQMALTRDPNFALAKANLADLRLPVGQRHGAWPLSWEQWLTPPTLEAFRRAIERAQDTRGQRLVTGLEEFFDTHPDFVAMLPRIAERGGPMGQQFLVLTAEQIKHPDLLATLKDFALGQNGTDELRHKAAILASQAKLLDKTNVTLWIKGSWQTITLMDFEIHNEILYDHSKRVGQWLKQAIHLLRQQTLAAAEQAESLLQKAIAAEPESPDLLNNLASAYLLQGREAEAETLIQSIHQRFPDYVMAAMSQAKLFMHDGDLAAAEAILQDFMGRDRFHIQEFSAFCETYIELMLAKNQLEGARKWLDMWAQADPNNPRLDRWRYRLDTPPTKNILEL